MAQQLQTAASPTMSSRFKSFLVALFGVIAAIYLINPTAGFVEFIPDNFPIIGNLDEATATTIVIAALAHFGWDVTKLWRK